MRMSVARAMKEKNRLVRSISQLEETFRYNVTEERSSETPVNVNGNIEEWINLKDKLVKLKVAIGKANAESGALQCVYAMEEARGTLSRLNCVPTDVNSTWSRNPVTGEMEEFRRSASISQSQVEDLKNAIQQKVDDLQDKLDEINATTFIEL